MRLFYGLVLIALYLPALALAAIFDLSQLHWTLKNQNGTIVIPASVPSQAHLDLLAAGLITEPLLGINDFTERWIADDNWTYTADLSPWSSETVQNASGKTLLVFYGIDTIANITFAGHPVAWVNNQFRQYVYDVSDLLKSIGEGDSNLTVALESAYHYGLNVTSRPDAEQFPSSISDNFEYPGVRQYIRKIASDFGWDWGPAFVPSGIFKPAYLVTLSEAITEELGGTPPVSPLISNSSDSPMFIEESSIDIYKVGQNFSVAPDQTANWVVNVSLALRSASNFLNPSLILSIPELNLVSDALPVSPIKSTAISATWVGVTWQIPDKVPERWYPHNLGKPKLYNLTVTLQMSHEKSVSFTTTTGFRTIQLVQSPYSQEDVDVRGITPGDQWHFEINGKAFYAKGTNIIPFDPFYARTKPEAVKWVLESAVKSGQNMLRIWGGGIYQPSDSSIAGGLYDFYSVCDELGILAWSELIFSDTVYPINDFLLESIEPEVRQNVRRINRHPSNVQWAGGNEIEGIVEGAPTHYLDEFLFLFRDFLQKIVVSETRSVAYTDCSTTHGVLSLEPYTLRLNNATPGEIYGNSERYNYDATQAFSLSTYPVSRFVNEFGFHSMPSFYSWEDVLTSVDDFNFNSSVVMSRDHHPPAGDLTWPNPNAPQGQQQMTSAVNLWLPTPSTSDANQTFAQWCWSTQIFQSMNMVSEIAFYRSGAGKGENNLGSLVWQLNDIWQGVSWSSIEYSGRWKVLQYGLAKVYSPVIISPFWTAENQTLEVLVTSDALDIVHGMAQLTWYDWNGTEVDSSRYNFAVPALNNSKIFHASGLQSILPRGKNETEVWLLLNVTANIDNKTTSNEQYFTPSSLAQASLVDPRIKVSSNGTGNFMTFTLSATAVAPWTWIDHPLGTIGYFVDNLTGIPSNGFYLVPGIERTIKFVMNEALSKVTRPDPVDFVVRSLWNNTHI
ncbi:glycoside hydrolase family 2 protein [Piloderma croceum F 1598]|uniref:Beta-mannosidase A n=1 Tax=Piloderma croceum (strain F 1598) TaxID=765440 RepID=A0A0C3AXX5_PILCF|nr:glycoside hydrolase family 2 protein [Piloderma croceum F 1598]